jgi:hypothetical protein
MCPDFIADNAFDKVQWMMTGTLVPAALEGVTSGWFASLFGGGKGKAKKE